jgi:RNA polymerase-binding transcription factor DksA
MMTLTTKHACEKCGTVLDEDRLDMIDYHWVCHECEDVYDIDGEGVF